MTEKSETENPERPTGVVLHPVVRRVFQIKAVATQWWPGAKIKGVWDEHPCMNIMGCQCKIKRRARVSVGNAVTNLCPGMWIVKDSLGQTRILKDAEMKTLTPNDESSERGAAGQPQTKAVSTPRSLR